MYIFLYLQFYANKMVALRLKFKKIALFCHLRKSSHPTQERKKRKRVRVFEPCLNCFSPKRRCCTSWFTAYDITGTITIMSVYLSVYPAVRLYVSRVYVNIFEKH